MHWRATERDFAWENFFKKIRQHKKISTDFF